MAGLKTFPQKPYFDDYSADKDYLRVLFRPGYAVQTREVNQLQTILQSQISRMGDHFFENGARVVRGEASYNKSFNFITFNTPLSRNADSYAGLTITKGGSSVVAKSMFCVKATGGDPDTLYVQYTSGSGSDTNTFSAGDILTITHSDSQETAIVGSVGVGSVISLDEGIYYISGQFVVVPKSSLVLNKYESDTTGTFSVGFTVDHKIITDADDVALLDNAAGTTNYSAPGAHRYKIVPTLVNKVDISASQLESYIEIVRVVEGSIATKVRVDDYTVFQDILAQRTFDESGDYVTDEFVLDVKEHLQTTTNRGHYSLANGGSESKLVYALDPGKAYVRGYPVETAYNTFLVTDKARTTTTHENVFTTLSYASSIRINTTESFVFGVAVDLKVSGVTRGTATVRDVRFVSTGVVDLDLVDIELQSGYGISSITTVEQGSSDGTVVSYNYDATNSALVYELPFGYVENLQSASLYYRRQFNITAALNVVSLSSSDVFSGNVDDYVCQYAHSTGVALVKPNSVTLLSGGQSAQLTLPHTPTSVVMVTAGLIKSQATFRAKNLSTQVDTVAFNALTLTKTDGVRLVSVVSGGSDVTAAYSFDGGQRDTVYDFARLVAKSGAPTSGSVVVTYEYFAHSAGDYFCKNSYASIDYGSIPSYTFTNGKNVFLGSVVDFRRSVTAGGMDYTDGSASSFKVNSEIITDYTTYLARYDKIMVDKFGVFFVKQGTPASNPIAPSDVDNALTLYTVLVKPYTFSNTDVSVSATNNRRYTMRDIGKLDTRLDTVEYYTSLNLLEKQTMDQNFVNKFNTGFLVDNFKSQAVADVTSPELSIGYDLTAGEIRPQTPSKFVPLGFQSGTNTSVVDGLLMLNYTSVPYISQTLASEVQRIQPYIQYGWNGAIKLEPSQDSWHDVQYLPDVVVDGGVFSVLTNTNGFDTTVNFAYGDLGLRSGTVSATSQNGFVTTTSTTTTEFRSSTNTEFVGDRFVGNTPATFIRSRIIKVTGVGLKPNTKLHVYFDETNVDAHSRPVGGNYGDSIVSTGAGSFECEFLIPSTDSLRFRAGSRVLKITDVAPGQQPSTSGTAAYNAGGVIEQRNNVFMRTRHDTINSRTETSVVDNTSSIAPTVPSPSSFGFGSNRSGGDSDPLAQSFMVSSSVGAFITGVDIFFGPDAATNTSSATVELRGMENGYPSTDVLARKLLPASSLVPSSNGFNATTFTFDHPVFLEGNKEYCFVVKSDSETLTIWTSTLGAKSYVSTDTTTPTGEVITKQSFLGSLFRSQNDRTWTAEQTSDIKFVLNRASFASSTGSATLNNVVPTSDVVSPYSQSLYNALTFTSGSNTVKVDHKNHGFVTGEFVTITGSGVIAGIPSSELFGVAKQVTVIDGDSYTIQTTTNATSSLVGGGSVVATSKVVFSESVLRASDITPSGSKISYKISTKIRGVGQDLFVNTQKHKQTKFSTVRVSDVSGDNTIQLSVDFVATAGGFISPVIDLHDLGVVAVANRINASGTPKAVYVQKAITLKNAADEFATYMDVNRPSGSSVQLFYRIAQDNVATSPWIEATPSGAQLFATDDTTFNEYKFVNTGATGDFFVIQIEIVLWSSNEALVPRIRNLRTITLKGA